MPVMPESSTCDPALTAWLYSGELGASAVFTICRGMAASPWSIRIIVGRPGRLRRVSANHPVRGIARAADRLHTAVTEYCPTVGARTRKDHLCTGTWGGWP